MQIELELGESWTTRRNEDSREAEATVELKETSVGECPCCGGRSWPKFTIAMRHLTAHSDLGPDMEERTRHLQALAARLPRARLEPVYCERCTLDQKISRKNDDTRETRFDPTTSKPAPVTKCPDCGKRSWSNFSVVMRYLAEHARCEDGKPTIAQLRELAWGFAPAEVEYELCVSCTERALQPKAEPPPTPTDPVRTLPKDPEWFADNLQAA